MKNFKITIEYDGTNYNGWQAQAGSKKLSTIQGELESVFHKILCKKVHIEGSGRTDAGVHAEGQCASFKSDTKIPLGSILQAVNTYLPDDIKVKEIKIVPDSFNARFNAKKKWYRYVVQNKKILSVFDRYYSAHYYYELDIKLMKKAGKIMRGRHDFSGIGLTTALSFERAGRAKDENTVRNVYKVSVFRKGGFVFIDVIGNGFLYKMVRRIVGLLLNVGRGKIQISDVQKILSGKRINLDIQTAPAKGLTLMKVYY